MRIRSSVVAGAYCTAVVTCSTAIACCRAFVDVAPSTRSRSSSKALVPSFSSSFDRHPPQRKHAPTLKPYQTPSYLRSTPPSNSNNEEDTAISRAISAVVASPIKSVSFSVLISLCGAALGPFLDSYHSAFGVLSYDEPLTAQLWGPTPDNPALITAWWVPELFGLAGFIIGWLYILLDAALQSPAAKREPSPPLILVGISFFTFQYWLSGILYANGVDRGTILNVMSVMAAVGFVGLDLSEAGLWTSLATAVGGPAIEVGLITLLAGYGGYHYNDLGETGFFPLWILPVYFLGGPAVGNLSRGLWKALSSLQDEGVVVDGDSAAMPSDTANETEGPDCAVCNDSRAVGCPNCDALGYYITYGRKVTCPACNGRGLVICRDCFPTYGEDPNDIEAIRDLMSKMPD
eukprot:CAMPEP_0178625486 /NCGR_PEP_ID=MMETSP0698-20121128/7905_1 /TAXON_ID=265572 /ORGANISM="Extubocellulus spinifer, Strain CCMP396" /LENGTH=404 /DNA_ID=CAMNT_0020264655 /DNA_START=37 /DNA_END=1251 /DNA_ORIENTATION=-